ncbi:MAG: hypothetical protein LIP09_08710 [Bacteroidales bacterium]|nr:hypothetical protein [Bacteroidales bacterium]
MTAKPPSICFSPDQVKVANSMSECDKRHHLASMAQMLGPNGVRKVSNYFGINKKNFVRRHPRNKEQRLPSCGTHTSSWRRRQGQAHAASGVDCGMRRHSGWPQGRTSSAGTIVLLCDGGGSNSSSHRIFKQELMDLSDRLGLKILVMHYPPYCSKFNPIEHRLFSQITRSWSGAPLLTKENALERAAKTTTKTGLKVNVVINDKTYMTQRPIDANYEDRLKSQVVFLEKLSKWNYLIKPST